MWINSDDKMKNTRWKGMKWNFDHYVMLNDIISQATNENSLETK